MPRLRLAALALPLALALTGCPSGGGEEQASAAPETTQAASEAPMTTAASAAAPASTDAKPAASLADVEKAAGKPVKVGQTVTIETSKGKVTIALFPEAAPKTVANFVALAKQGFYDGTTFHRVIPGFVAQGGDPLSKTLKPGDPQIGTGGAEKTLEDEHGNGLKHLRGSVAMAHSSAPNSASSQFYICYDAIPHLDGGYTIFGQVTSGMDAVDKLNPTEADPAHPDKMVRVTVQ